MNQNKLKILIVEDEEPARNLLKSYLKDAINTELIGEFADGFSGVKSINEIKPDLVLLDVQMPKLNGFEVLELIEHKPAIIFTTAFDHFAIKAFEMNAVDYLLKPFTKDRFLQSIAKAEERIRSKKSESKSLNGLLNSIEEKNEYIDRIAVKSGSKIDVIAVSDIICFDAEGDYVMIHTRTGRYLKEKTMKYLESHLDSKQFVRIHRSCIVNVAEIAKIEHYDKESYAVLMKNQMKLKASMAGYKLLKELLKL